MLYLYSIINMIAQGSTMGINMRTSNKSKFVSAFLLVSLVLLPLFPQEAHAALTLTQINDVSNWLYVPAVPGTDDGSGNGIIIGGSQAMFENRITGETQATDWVYH